MSGQNLLRQPQSAEMFEFICTDCKMSISISLSDKRLVGIRLSCHFLKVFLCIENISQSDVT